MASTGRLITRIIYIQTFYWSDNQLRSKLFELFLSEESLTRRTSLQSNNMYPRHRKASLSYTRCSGCCLGYSYQPLPAFLSVHFPNSPEATVQCNSSVGMRSKKSKISLEFNLFCCLWEFRGWTGPGLSVFVEYGSKFKNSISYWHQQWL